MTPLEKILVVMLIIVQLLLWFTTTQYSIQRKRANALMHEVHTLTGQLAGAYATVFLCDNLTETQLQQAISGYINQ